MLLLIKYSQISEIPSIEICECQNYSYGNGRYERRKMEEEEMLCTISSFSFQSWITIFSHDIQQNKHIFRTYKVVDSWMKAKCCIQRFSSHWN